MRKIAFIVMLIALLFCGCTIDPTASNSGSYLVLERLGGEENTINIISVVNSATSDGGSATLKAFLRDRNVPDNLISPLDSIIIEQIDVRFTRSDGKNQQGLDVPFAFSNPVHATVPINGSLELGFNVIRYNSKLEPPLVNLHNYSQEKLLYLTAHITIHGKDGYDRRVAPVSGTISVTCGYQTGLND